MMNCLSVRNHYFKNYTLKTYFQVLHFLMCQIGGTFLHIFCTKKVEDFDFLQYTILFVSVKWEGWGEDVMNCAVLLDATIQTDISLGTGYSLIHYDRALSSQQERLDKLDELDRLDGGLDRFDHRLYHQLDRLDHRLDHRLEQLDHRLDQLDHRLDHQFDRLDQLNHLPSQHHICRKGIFVQDPKSLGGGWVLILAFYSV